MSVDTKEVSLKHIMEVIDNNHVGIVWTRRQTINKRTVLHKVTTYDMTDKATGIKYEFIIERYRGKPATYQVNRGGTPVEFLAGSDGAKRLCMRVIERREQEGQVFRIKEWLSNARRVEYDPLCKTHYQCKGEVYTVKCSSKRNDYYLHFDEKYKSVVSSRGAWQLTPDLFAFVFSFAKERVMQTEERFGQNNR